MLHRILPSNTFLKKIGYVDSDRCTFCKNEVETIEHLLYDCNFVEKFWSSVMCWMRGIKIVHAIDKKSIILGLPLARENNVVNWFILQGKLFIFITKTSGSNLSFEAFKLFVKLKFDVETKFLRKNKPEEHNTLWKMWSKLFET